MQILLQYVYPEKQPANSEKPLPDSGDLVAKVDRDHASSPGIFLVVKKADLQVL
jgi:hypothetical protein